MNIEDIKNDVVEETVENEPTEKEKNIVLQNLIRNYLEVQNLPSMKEVLAKEGKEEEEGVLTDTHIKLLQCMIKDYFLSNGESIEEKAGQRGIRLVEGVLSPLETETLDTLINDYCETIKKINEAAE